MYKMSWNEFECLALEVAKNIKLEKKTYDSLVCVSRGGLLLGKILSEVLDVPLSIVSAKYVNGVYYVDNNISSTKPVKGNVLLIDDVLEETYEKIIPVIKNKSVAKIDLACVFFRSKNKTFKPDFYINEIKEDLWVSFPYQSKHLKEEFTK